MQARGLNHYFAGHQRAVVRIRYIERPTALYGKDQHLLEFRAAVFRKVMKQRSVYPPLPAGLPLSPGQFSSPFPIYFKTGLPWQETKTKTITTKIPTSAHVTYSSSSPLTSKPQRRLSWGHPFRLPETDFKFRK